MRALLTMLGMSMLAGCGSAGTDWPQRTIRVAVETPNPCWRVSLERIYRAGTGLLAVSRLQGPEPGQMCAQVISTASHQVTFPAPEGPVTHLVLGKTWQWGGDAPGYEFPESREALERRIGDAELLREISAEEGERDDDGALE